MRFEVLKDPAADSDAPGTIKAYADGWHPVGSARQMRIVFKHLYEQSPHFGMEIAPEKCSCRL